MEIAAGSFENLVRRFHATQRPVDFDFRKFCVNWVTRGDTYTHRIHRYPARLTPYIPLYFLSIPSIGVKGGTLLDPFAGCGTVLVEGPVHECQPMNSLGLEINPLARMIAKVKTTPLAADLVVDHWNRVVLRYKTIGSNSRLPPFPNKSFWFSAAVERRLARLHTAIEATRSPDIREFFLICFSSVVRKVALADPSISVPVRLNPTRFSNGASRRWVRRQINERSAADVLTLVASAVEDNLERLAAWTDRVDESRCRVALTGNDARTFSKTPYQPNGQAGKRTGKIRDVDLILTSPPYVNAQRYTRSLRLELFALGLTTGGDDEAALDRQQIGTERVPRDDWETFDTVSVAPTAMRAIAKIRSKDRYRAAILSKYVADMTKVVTNAFTSLKPGGHAVFVVGNNTVRGTLVHNSNIVSEMGRYAGFDEVVMIRNRIPSRGLLTKRHHTARVITHEHLIVLRKPVS
jgi:hypothetical protein